MRKLGLCRSRRGSAAIEFMLILPVWLMMIFPVIDYSIYLLSRQALLEAVQAGARVGSMTALVDDPAAVAATMVGESLSASIPNRVTDATVTAILVDTNGSSVAGNANAVPVAVQVDITMMQPPLFGFVSMPNTISVTQTMTLESL